MLHLSPFWFCTNTVPGGLCTALDAAADFGFKYVELSAIDGVSEQIVAEKVCDEYVADVKNELEKRGLSCIAVSGHCDITEDSSFSRFLKKLEFAGKIGAKYLNTRCGPKARYSEFRQNLSAAVKAARPYNLQINLESYGDIVGGLHESYDVFEDIGNDNVRYNYDPGNIFRFARGDVSFVHDLAGDMKYLDTLHIKDAAVKDGFIVHTAVGYGDVRFEEIFDILGVRLGTIGAGLEMPQTFKVRLSDFSRVDEYPTPAQTYENIAKSLDFIRAHCLIDM